MTLERDDSDTDPNAVDKVIDVVFLVIFSLEIILKVVAQGLVLHKHTYLHDGWNCLDFLIVLCALLQLFAGDGIWAFMRILRPLRLINKIDGLKVIVSTLWKSMHMMRDVFLLLTFLMCAFAIFGMHLWSDEMYQRCFAVVPIYMNGTEQLYPIDGFTPSNWLGNCSNGTLLRGDITMNGTFRVLVTNDSMLCDPAGLGRPFVCRADAIHWPQECGENVEPLHPVFNFDHFGNAMLFILKIFSLDNWSDTMKEVMASTGNWACIYFIVATLFGGYLCLNLVIAVLSMQFTAEEIEGDADETKEKMKAGYTGMSPLTCLSVAVLRPVFVCALDVGVDQTQSLVIGLGARHRKRSTEQLDQALPPDAIDPGSDDTSEEHTTEWVPERRLDDVDTTQPVPEDTRQKQSKESRPPGWIHNGCKPLKRIVCSFYLRHAEPLRGHHLRELWRRDRARRNH